MLLAISYDYVSDTFNTYGGEGRRSWSIDYQVFEGDPEPSEEDEKNTRKLELACDNVGIKLIDHIIITGKSHFSFYDNGLM